MSTTFLFEHSKTVNFNASDAVLKALDRLNNKVRGKVLSDHRGELEAFQYVGVVRLGNSTIQILPKMFPHNKDDNEEEHARDATRNLLYLLSYARELKIREHEIAGLLTQNIDWFEILTHLFASNLTKEWKLSANRSYETIEEELPLVKGKLRVVEQLKYPERKHLFSVVFDELTIDNALNRIFRFVVERLYHLTRNIDNRRELGRLRQYMKGVTLVSKLSVVDANLVILTRLNTQYTPLLNLARLFLNGGALQLSTGDLTSFAFVFNMDKLFETFIVNFIQRHRDKILPAHLQECELLPQSRGATLYLSTRDGKQDRKANPDLVLRQGDQYPLIIDIKYKVLDPYSRKLSVSSSDFHQMNNYAGGYHCPHALLIYPQTSDMDEPLLDKPEKSYSGVQIVAATVDLRVDLCKREGQEKLIEGLRNILEGKDV